MYLCSDRVMASIFTLPRRVRVSVYVCVCVCVCVYVCVSFRRTLAMTKRPNHLELL